MKVSRQDSATLEETIWDSFGLEVVVESVILWRVDVSRTAQATIFLTKKKQLLAYIDASAPLVLADVKKMVSRMGLTAELYIPPKGQPNYFDEIGKMKFLQVFPGRKAVSADDVLFYKTLAPYNPALVMVSGVKNGEIYQYDADARSSWRVGAKFAYRRIRTS